MSTLRFVGGIFTFALIHRIVVHQAHLISSESLIAVSGSQLLWGECTIPHTSLHHATLIEFATLLIAIHLIGTSENEISRTRIRLIHFKATHRLTTDEQRQDTWVIVLGRLADDHRHLLEETIVKRVIRFVFSLIVNHRLEFLVSSYP